MNLVSVIWCRIHSQIWLRPKLTAVLYPEVVQKLEFFATFSANSETEISSTYRGHQEYVAGLLMFWMVSLYRVVQLWYTTKDTRLCTFTPRCSVNCHVGQRKNVNAQIGEKCLLSSSVMLGSKFSVSSLHRMHEMQSIVMDDTGRQSVSHVGGHCAVQKRQSGSKSRFGWKFSDQRNILSEAASHFPQLGGVGSMGLWRTTLASCLSNKLLRRL